MSSTTVIICVSDLRDYQGLGFSRSPETEMLLGRLGSGTLSATSDVKLAMLDANGFQDLACVHVTGSGSLRFHVQFSYRLTQVASCNMSST